MQSYLSSVYPFTYTISASHSLESTAGATYSLQVAAVAAVVATGVAVVAVVAEVAVGTLLGEAAQAPPVVMVRQMKVVVPAWEVAPQ